MVVLHLIPPWTMEYMGMKTWVMQFYYISLYVLVITCYCIYIVKIKPINIAKWVCRSDEILVLLKLIDAFHYFDLNDTCKNYHKNKKENLQHWWVMKNLRVRHCQSLHWISGRQEGCNWVFLPGSQIYSPRLQIYKCNCQWVFLPGSQINSLRLQIYKCNWVLIHRDYLHVNS